MSIRTLLYHLPLDLANELRDTLIGSRIVPEIEEAAGVADMHWSEFDIVFCPSSLLELSPVLSAVAVAGAHPPVIAVTRFPEDEEWLDALDLGAADYCAPPFEASQLRWVMDKHVSRGPKAAV